MGVEKTRVQVDVVGEAPAAAAAERLERKVQLVEQRARIASDLVDDAERNSGGSFTNSLNRLLSRAKSGVRFGEGGVNFGPAEFGHGGFRVSGGQVIPTRGLAAYAAYKGFEGALESYADWRDEGGTFKQWLRSRPQTVATEGGSAGADLFHVPSRFTHGFDREQADFAIGELKAQIAWFYGDDYRSPLDEAILEQGRQRQRFFDAMAEEAAQLAREKLRKRDALASAFEVLDEELAARYAKVRVTRLPIKVSEEMFQRMLRDKRAREEFKTNELKRKLTEAVGS